MSSNSRGTIGILVGGGPAPGINGVIGAAAIEAHNQGFRVLGIRNDELFKLVSGQIQLLRSDKTGGQKTGNVSTHGIGFSRGLEMAGSFVESTLVE